MFLPEHSKTDVTIITGKLNPWSSRTLDLELKNKKKDIPNSTLQKVGMFNITLFKLDRMTWALEAIFWWKQEIHPGNKTTKQTQSHLCRFTLSFRQDFSLLKGFYSSEKSKLEFLLWNEIQNKFKKRILWDNICVFLFIYCSRCWTSFV